VGRTHGSCPNFRNSLPIMYHSAWASSTLISILFSEMFKYIFLKFRTIFFKKENEESYQIYENISSFVELEILKIN
jgi:hypothetical protein